MNFTDNNTTCTHVSASNDQINIRPPKAGKLHRLIIIIFYGMFVLSVDLYNHVFSTIPLNSQGKNIIMHSYLWWYLYYVIFN